VLARKRPSFAELLAEMMLLGWLAPTEELRTFRLASGFFQTGRFAMQRKKKRPEPFFRKFDGWWYVQLGKEQIKLAKGADKEDAAWTEYYRVMNQRGRSTPAEPIQNPTVNKVCNRFLDWSLKHNAERTYQWYSGFLGDFCKHHGRVRLAELQPIHVTTWLDQHPHWTTSRRGAIIAIKRAINWAHAEGLIQQNPLKAIRKPPPKSRDRFLTAEERQQIYDNYKDGDPFLPFLRALQETGARPGEIAKVSSEQVNLHAGTWEFDKHKTASRTNEKRIIILTPAMAELTRNLMTLVPPGTPLFRNRKGKPWNRNAIRCRFKRVREKLGLGHDVVAYLYRHAFCTDMLESGAGLAQTCEILGHKGTGIVMRHYSKLRDRREHLRQQIIAATQHGSA
jgi:integrase